MTLILYWVAVALVLYTYILFPGIVFLRKFLRCRPYKSASVLPPVSMIIAAHNEAHRIGAKMQNILSLDYPCTQLEVIVASDGSSDHTDAIVGSYSERGVKLLSLPRVGKAAALNAAVETSKGEILVFSDANSMFEPGAIRAIVRPFADPQVGGVAGNQCYVDPSKCGASAEGERSYWNLDRQLKQSQSQAGNAISATGAIYAIRRFLFRPVPPGVTDDFVTSTSVIAQGYRLVFAPDAVAREPVANTNEAEFRRKIRVITRGLRGVWVMRELLDPFKYGFYAIQLFSHKVMRRLVVVPLLLLLLVSPLLWEEGLFYQTAMLTQGAFYGCGVLGMIFARKRLGRSKLLAIPYFFCMVNAASLIAIWNVLRGHRIDRWEPQHAEAIS